jgi:hypothetical protein
MRKCKLTCLVLALQLAIEIVKHLDQVIVLLNMAINYRHEALEDAFRVEAGSLGLSTHGRWEAAWA